MNSFIIVAYIALFFAYAASASSEVHSSEYTSRDAEVSNAGLSPTMGDSVSVKPLGPYSVLKRRVQRRGECPSQVCFALDGSNSISERDFGIVQTLTRSIAGVVGVAGGTSFSAVQYGTRTSIIQTSTSNVGEFRRAVLGATYSRASRSFLTAGFSYCVRTISRTRRLKRTSSVVVIGSGQTAVLSRFLTPVVSSVRPATVYAIGIGASQNRDNLLKLTNGNNSRVFTIGRRQRDSSVVEVVRRVCRRMCSL